MHVGRYEIVGELGRGGMARVHLARQLDLDRYAALKELGWLQREDAEMAARFLRESRLAGALNHTCIVTVLDFFEHEGTRYIAMEYVPRGSLRPWVGRLSFEQVGGVLENVLAGLAHAHAHGVIHRDLKPENLMVTDEGRVKITDFGIAKALTPEDTSAFRTATGATLGTPAYMAPEQAMGEGVGPWTDLYAVGVIAYELLSGTVPFSNVEPVAVMLAHIQQDPPPLCSHAPDVPEPIAAWVHGLLAKAPDDRPDSARAAWEELEEHLLEGAGPRWRRTARIGGEPSEAGGRTPSGRPITPAQFATAEEGWETFADPSSRWDAPAPTRESVPPPDAAPTRETAAPQSAGTPPAGATPPPPSGAPLAGEASSRAATAPTAVLAPPRRRARWLVLAGAGLAAVLVAVALAVALSAGDETTGPPRTATDSADGDGPAPLGADWMRAIHLRSRKPDGYRKPAFVKALRHAKGDGATHVIFRPRLTAPSTTSAELIHDEESPTDDTLADGLAVAQREGFKTIVAPLIDFGNSYAGDYAPSDPGDFFDAYEERVAGYADVAGEAGSDTFVVGSLLSQLDDPDYSDRWTAILADARRRCHCRVTYEAENVKGAERVKFWDATDAIWVAPFEELTAEPTDDADTLLRAWADRKRQLHALNVRWEKPVTIGTLGYQSRSDASAASVTQADGDVSQGAQAALFEAAFRTFRGTPWFGGIAWFEFNVDGEEPPDDIGFVGKQAEQVLRAWHTAR